MIQNVLRNLAGIEHFGVLSVLLFFACFLGVILWAWTRRKSYLDAMSRLPLEDPPTDPDSQPLSVTRHE